MESEEKNVKLDDTQRVRVLSPGQMVAKRFFRNKLAIAGLVIIICMFLFAFLGGAIMPYSESEVFYTTEVMKKDYAGATYIDDFQLIEADGMELPSDILSKLLIAVKGGEYVFESRSGQLLGLAQLDENVYCIYELEKVTDADVIKSDEYAAAVDAGVNYLEYNGTVYLYDGTGAKGSLYIGTELGIACKLSFTAYSSDTEISYAFSKEVLAAMGNGESAVTVDGVQYTVEQTDESSAMVYDADGIEYAYVSDMNINAITSGVFLTPDFKLAAREAIESDAESFEWTDEEGAADTYLLSNSNGQYTIKRYQETRVIATYQSPSRAHWLGTDANGMDLLARLMYGGRISLLIGFVVVIIEVIIGVIVGGIAGFFGGWVDNLLMRFVDIIYCIPSLPLYLILGSIMDYYKATSTVRIYMLCIVISVIGWVGIARIVRGQILSLREQEFMTAAEATGISVWRRIFKHLVPNVIPQLVVFASMGVGDVILTESTLSFLGLGIKYPAASWGSIINAVNDSYVMTNYLFVWIPAGVLILLTVLAFNFIGDGLRDAFDPKMKR